jgi:hypothetical protein
MFRSRLLFGDTVMSETAVNQESVSLEPELCDAVARNAGARNAGASVWASIQATLAAIRQDSATSPATYLEDTVVPHGGE